jgi:hypothetical protein
VSYAAKYKTLSQPEKLSLIFYIVSGIVLLALLAVSNFAPHLALLGVLSLFTAGIVLIKKGWAVPFVAVQFVTAMVFSLWTIFAVGTGNWPVTVGLVVYAVLDLIATLYLTIWRKDSV